MGLHLGSGVDENTVKTHKIGESNFHLKGGSGLGPTKQSGAFPAEGGHRGSCLAHSQAYLEKQSMMLTVYLLLLLLPAQSLISIKSTSS